MDYGAALEMRFGATRRGFESRPLRHPPLHDLTRPGGVVACARSLTHLGVRSLPCSAPPCQVTPSRGAPLHDLTRLDRFGDDRRPRAVSFSGPC